MDIVTRSADSVKRLWGSLNGPQRLVFALSVVLMVGLLMWGSGLEDGNKHTRQNLPFIVAGKGGGALRTGRFLADTQGNQGDLLTTLLTCAGIPLDRPIGSATKQLKEMCLASES